MSGGVSRRRSVDLDAVAKEWAAAQTDAQLANLLHSMTSGMSPGSWDPREQDAVLREAYTRLKKK